MPDLSECTVQQLVEAIQAKTKVSIIGIQDSEGNYTFWRDGTLMRLTFILELAKRKTLNEVYKLYDEEDVEDNE